MKHYLIAIGLLAACSGPALAQQTNQTRQTGQTSQSNTSNITSQSVRDGTIGLGTGGTAQRSGPGSSPSTVSKSTSSKSTLPKTTTDPNAQPSTDEATPK